VSGECDCSAAAVERYARRLSGPLLDRVDLVCRVHPVASATLVGAGSGPGEPSARVRERVVAARDRQLARLAGAGALCNAEMDARTTRREIGLDPELVERLIAVVDGGLLSARGHDRLLRVARTVADLGGRSRVGIDDLDEALAYRVSRADLIAA